MASGRKLRKQKEVAVALESAGITNIASADAASITNSGYIIDTVTYGSGSANTVFTEGSTTLLSDVNSSGDYVWNLLGYAGETSANAAGFIPSNAIHRYIPYAGATSVNLTDSSPVILYTKDGPLGRFNQFYLPTAAKTASGTGSLVFSSAISGAAAGFTKLKIFVAGALPTGSTGSTLFVVSGSTPIITYTSSSTADPVNTTASFPAIFPYGISGSLPDVGDQLSITLPIGYAGLAATASYLITLTSSLTPTASGNNMYIVAGAAGVNFTGSTFHSILRQGINGTSIATTSSVGSSFANLSGYVSASDSVAGVSLFAKQNGGTAYSIAVSGSNNKIKKVAGINYFQFQPFFVTASFNTASMGTLTITYSSSADTYNLNSFTPGIIVYITGSNS